MKIKKITFSFLMLLALLLTVSAGAAVLPVKIPAFNSLGGLTAVGGAPSLNLPSVPMPLLPSAPSLPSIHSPYDLPLRLPGVQNPLPLSLPARLSDDDIHLDWSFLDGKAGAAAAVPNDRGPKPLPPAGAAVQLKFAAKAARPTALIHVGADELFDQARPRILVEAE